MGPFIGNGMILFRMRRLLPFLASGMIACAEKPAPAPAAGSDANLAHANAVLAATPVMDGHNDLPWRIREDTVARGDASKYDLTHAPGMTDIPRLKAGHLGAQFWSVYIPGDSAKYGYAKMQAEQIRTAKAFVARYPDTFVWALTAHEIRDAMKSGRIASLMGVEGGHAIENNLDSLRSYYRQGARYMTLTHNVTLDWADAALDSAKHAGLTAFGESVVKEMNKLGMLVDLSHVSDATMSDALNTTEAPVIFSHSAARALTDHRRDVPDSILQRLPKNGGVVMVTFVPSFVSQEVNEYDKRRDAVFDSVKKATKDTAAIARADTAWVRANASPRATIAQVADHIEHVRKVAGIDHVGIGSDFDGITETVVGLDDVSKYPALFAALIARGWSDEDLKKLASENVLRVLEEAEHVAARLKAAKPATKAATKKP